MSTNLNLNAYDKLTLNLHRAQSVLATLEADSDGNDGFTIPCDAVNCCLGIVSRALDEVKAAAGNLRVAPAAD